MERIEQDCHHPYFERNAQSYCKLGKAIVNAYSFPILMDYDVHHHELHPNCKKLPIPAVQTLKVVTANFETCDSPLKTIDNLMYAFHKAEIDSSLSDRDRQVASQVIDGLYKQLPYIRYGMIKQKR